MPTRTGPSRRLRNAVRPLRRAGWVPPGLGPGLLLGASRAAVQAPGPQPPADQLFDRDGDGFGDTPHAVLRLADRLWMETPMATFFRNSPAPELLDFLERLVPFTSPYRVLIDPRPRLRAAEPPAPPSRDSRP